MVKIAKIRENDELTGRIIWIGYERVEYDGAKGWRLYASNGDDIGYYAPKSKAACISDAYAMYDRWDTFEAKK